MVQVHHLSYRNLGAEPLSDLQGLCMRCHKLEHHHPSATRLLWHLLILIVGVLLLSIAIAMLIGSGAHAGPLCVDGHPSRRPPGITYGGLPPRRGLERDHRLPLCAGGQDAADNVWYQSRDDAAIKDQIEWATCEAMCRGELTVDQAQSMPAFQPGYWRGDGGDHP